MLIVCISFRGIMSKVLKAVYAFQPLYPDLKYISITQEPVCFVNYLLMVGGGGGGGGGVLLLIDDDDDDDDDDNRSMVVARARARARARAFTRLPRDKVRSREISLT